MDGILRDELDASLLRPGDVLFFLMEDYNLQADGPLLERDQRQYGTWHTGFFHSHVNGEHRVLHAAPGEQVRYDPIERIAFDGVYVLRLEAS
jgi:hypothetical protein